MLADLTDKAAVADQVQQAQADTVVHLAAISFVGNADDAAFYSVNVTGCINLLSACAALPQKPRKVLLASSANIYGNCANSPIGEEQTPAPVNHYGTSKLAMEHLARTYADRLPLVITRPFNYTGPGQGKQFLIPKLVEHFARKAPQIELGNLHVEREFNDGQLILILALLAGVIVATGAAFLVFRQRLRAMFYIVAAGTLYGFVVTITKVLINRWRTDHIDPLMIVCFAGLVIAAVLGGYFVQTAYSVGSPDLVIAGLTVIDPLVAIAIAITVLGEADMFPPFAMVGITLGGALSVVGVILLARHHPQTHH